jgi:hypothetical protein
MRKRIQAAVAPVVIVAAIAGAAGYRVSSGPAKRLDELSQARPAAATHFPADSALVAASQAAAEQRWLAGAQARQMEVFLQAVADAQAAQDAQVSKSPAPARTGRTGGGGGTTVSGACGGATNGADAYIGRESGGNPNARNPSGAWGCYQIMPGTWSSSCSDIGAYGSASPSQQAQCASRLPQSSWGG